jgi:hypothetical protein
MRKKICLLAIFAICGLAFAGVASAAISVDAPKTQVFMPGDQLSTNFTVNDTVFGDSCTFNGLTFQVFGSANVGTSVFFGSDHVVRPSYSLVCGSGSASWTTTFVFAGMLG